MPFSISNVSGFSGFRRNDGLGLAMTVWVGSVLWSRNPLTQLPGAWRYAIVYRAALKGRVMSRRKKVGVLEMRGKRAARRRDDDALRG